MRNFLSLCLCGVIAGAGWTNAGPMAVAPEPEYDFGAVREGTTVTHEFVLENAGDDPLEVTGVVTSCAHCLSVEPHGGEAAPGEKLLFRATLLPTRGLTGSVERQFTVLTNAREQPALVFRIRGTIKPWYRLKPLPFFLLRGLKPGKAASWEFDLNLVDLPDCALLGTTSPEGFGIVAALNEKRRTHHLTIRYGGRDLPVGLYRSSIRLATDSAALRVIEIPLMARVPGSVQALPPVLLLVVPAVTDAGDSPGFRPVRKSVQVRGTSSTPFSILEAASPNPALNVTFSKSPATRHRLNIILSAPLPRGKVGDLIISTNTPGGGELRIPVHVAPAPDDRTTAPPAQPTKTAFSADKILPAVAGALGKSLEELIAGIGKGGEADLAVWAASQLARRSPNAAELRRKLGGIGLVRYARARDMITLQMAHDPVFAARCRRIVEQARTLATGTDNALE